MPDSLFVASGYDVTKLIGSFIKAKVKSMTSDLL